MLLLMGISGSMVLFPVPDSNARQPVTPPGESRSPLLSAVPFASQPAHNPTESVSAVSTLSSPVTKVPSPKNTPRMADRPTSQTPEIKASWPRTRTIKMRVTAYCACAKCCGKFADGRTASGKSIYANGSMFVAADTRIIPMQMMVSIPGYHGGVPVPVLDRGRLIKGNRLDVFFLSHETARKWGNRKIDVTVYIGD